MRKYALIPIEQYKDTMNVVIEEPSKCEDDINNKTSISEKDHEQISSIQYDDAGDLGEVQNQQEQTSADDDANEHKQSIGPASSISNQKEGRQLSQVSPFNTKDHGKRAADTNDSNNKKGSKKQKKKNRERKDRAGVGEEDKKEEEEEEEEEEEKKALKKDKKKKDKDSSLRSSTLQTEYESVTNSKEQKKSNRIKHPSNKKLESIESEIYWLEG